ncbi:MAG: zinc ribbon domain-containing protein [Clostridia bacterium]|nr:zinc ribbon domain-containing protein [Clostridia bacterium]
MNCKYCGNEMNEGALFCAACGKNVEDDNLYNNKSEEVVADTNEMSATVLPGNNADKKNNDILNKIKAKLNFDTVLLLVGILIIIIGFVRLMDSSVSVSSTSFGGDFYTYSYKGIVACARLLGAINETLSWGLIAAGVVVDLKALKGIFSKK